MGSLQPFAPLGEDRTLVAVRTYDGGVKLQIESCNSHYPPPTTVDRVGQSNGYSNNI